jgi:TLD
LKKKNDSHYNVKSIPYDFNLLYRASRDGNTAAAFHKKCDNKGATIVVIKITNSNQIVGGYNPLDWNGDGYKSTKDSFIFSFTNKDNLQSTKVCYSDGDSHSVGCDSFNGRGNGFRFLLWYLV